MKKIIPLTLLVMLLCGFMTVNAGTLKGNVYTFDNINAKVTFSSEGTYKNINGEPVLIFPKPVTMKIEGEADNGMLCDINVLKYSDEAFEYETADNFMDTVTLYTNSDFAETEVPEGAHLLVLSAKDDRGGGIPIIVGDIKINKINLPENAKISGWATKEVSEAFDSGLITTELYNNNDYQRNITRGEFAHVMAALLEQAGISYDKYIKGLGVNPIANFADTKNDF
ncbi:MAG: hypothetical protein Q8873_09440, partial [Bacillota bacterium]|nr:hypothetical protein [Bacillota bacterium]